MIRKLFDDIYYVGACDKSKPLFENLFPLPEGMRYNSYLIKDAKTALLDTADESVREDFLHNIEQALDGCKLDYLVIHHVEPDHSALVGELLARHTETQIVTSATALKFLTQFSGNDYSSRAVIVKEGDVLSLGEHSLKFIAAPMVHWPEVLVSYDEKSGTLFSADAFGAFGADLGGITIYALENVENWAAEARRYYSNIVGKFGNNVAELLKKASVLKINRICPLHGQIFDTSVDYALKKYSQWSSYTPENEGALIVYGSMYGNTKRAADLLAAELSDKGMSVKIVDVSHTDVSYIVADSFVYRNLIFASPTYYGSLYPPIERLLSRLKKTGLCGRKIAFIENGTWCATAAKLMKEQLDGLKCDFSLPPVSIKSTLDSKSKAALKDLAEALLKAE